jgi:UPF0755 protein
VTDYPDDAGAPGESHSDHRRLRTSEPDEYQPRHTQGSAGGYDAAAQPWDVADPTSGDREPGGHTGRMYTDGYDGYGDPAAYEGYGPAGTGQAAGGESGYDSAGYEAAGYLLAGPDETPEARYDADGYLVPGPGEEGYVEADYLNAPYTAADPADDGAAGYEAVGYEAAGYEGDDYGQAEVGEVADREPGYPDADYDETDYDETGYEAGYDDSTYEGDDGYDDAGVPPPPVEGGAHRQHSSGGRRRPPPAEFRRRRILAVLAFVVVVLVIAGGIGVLYARKQINPGGPPGPEVSIKIPADASSSEIGKILAAAGVIHDGSLFPYYVKLTSSTGLLPGTYRLKKNQSYGKVVNELQQGPTLITDKLIIPEGFTLAQIAARVAALPGLHLSAAKFLAAGTSGEVRSFFEPANSDNLEGLAFPATYEVQQGQAERDILSEMVNTFDTRAKQLGLAAAATKLHMTPYQVVTVASIVEREAKLQTDRGNVASTIYNRLAKGMTLGADSTQTYYLRLTDPTLQPSVAQLNAPSPYNTRLNPGLPPTPIANPGVPSLQAAVAPPATSYLYFVEINPDGKLGFGTTPADFTQLQAECQAAKLC